MLDRRAQARLSRTRVPTISEKGGRVTEENSASTLTDQVDNLPLHGLKVLDFTRVLSGPFCSAMLADAGAEVFKIETPEGDDYRHMGFQLRGRSTNFAFVNRGKQSLCLNLKAPEAAEVVERLALWADVALENFKPGVADRLGIGYGRLAAINPSLVYCSISGFGQTGEWAALPAYDVIIQALSGLMASTGEEDGSPFFVGESIADVSAGMFAAWGVMTALWQRQRTGRGRHLDVAMYDGLLSMMPTLVSRVAMGGVPNRRVGNRHLNSAPFGAFRAADGMFVLAVANNKLFRQLARALGNEGMSQDPRFASNQMRKRHELELQGVIEQWAGARTVREVVATLQACEVPVAPVMDVARSLREGPARSRDLVRSIELEDGTTACHIEQPVRFGTLPWGYAKPAPELGEHTASILHRLGYEAAQIERLMREGIVA